MEHFLRDIEISNFKSIRHQKIEGCKRINLFLGYPNVGKSNILEAIGSVGMLDLGGHHLVKNEVSHWIRYTKYRDIFFNGHWKEEAIIKIEDLSVHFKLRNFEGEFRLDVELHWDEGGTENYHFYDGKSKLVGSKLLKEGNSMNVSHSLDGGIRPYRFRTRTKFKSCKCINLATPNGENLLDVLLNYIDLRTEVSILFERYGLTLFIDESEDKIKIGKDFEKGSAYLIDYSLIADTLQRLIFYKAAIASNENSVLVFEEPEAHMFPPYIKSLMWDVVESKTNQFFIATHSPFVLDTLLEEGGEEVMIYLVDFKNGETVVKSISDTELEEIKRYGIDLFFNMEGYLKDAQQDDL